MDDKGKYKKIVLGKSDFYEQFSFAGGVAVDNLDRIIVSDTLSSIVRFFDNNGVELFRLSNGNEIDNFQYPITISIDKKGYIYILDRGSNQLKIYGYSRK